MSLNTAAATSFSAPVVAPKKTDNFRRLSRVLTDSPHKDPGASIHFTEFTRGVMKEMISYYGIAWLESKSGLCERSIYKMLAGYGEQCRPTTQRKLKKFLAGYIR